MAPQLKATRPTPPCLSSSGSGDQATSLKTASTGGEKGATSESNKIQPPSSRHRVVVRHESSSFDVSIDDSAEGVVEVGRYDEGDEEVVVDGGGGAAQSLKNDKDPAALHVSGKKSQSSSSASQSSQAEVSEEGERAPTAFERAEMLRDDDRILEAARVLRSALAAGNDKKSPSTEMHLTPSQRRILSEAESCESLLAEIKSDLGGCKGWKTWMESHGGSGGGGLGGLGGSIGSGIGHHHRSGHHSARRPRRHSLFHCKIDDENEAKLTARIETPVERSLLVPILAVLNETELYSTWFPDWTAPRLRIQKSVKLKQTGRSSQVLSVMVEVPWPLGPREAVINAVGCDDIESSGDIAIRLDGLKTGEEGGGYAVPPPEEKGTVRVDFRGGFLFRKCPDDHPAFQKLRKDKRAQKQRGSHHRGHRHHHLLRRHHRHHGKKHGEGECRSGRGYAEGVNGEAVEHEHVHDNAHDDDYILASFIMFNDAKAAVLPPAFMHFVMRTALGVIWYKFLKVAEDVRDGRRPRHAEAIAAKREALYDWVEERVGRMLELLQDGEGGRVNKIGSGE